MKPMELIKTLQICGHYQEKGVTGCGECPYRSDCPEEDRERLMRVAAETIRGQEQDLRLIKYPLFMKTLAAIENWRPEIEQRFYVLWEIIEEAGLEEEYQLWKTELQAKMEARKRERAEPQGEEQAPA